MATEGQHTLTYLFHTLSLLKTQISPLAKVSQLHRRMLVKQMSCGEKRNRTATNLLLSLGADKRAGNATYDGTIVF